MRIERKQRGNAPLARGPSEFHFEIAVPRIVDFVDWYDESKLTPKLIETINYLMVDTLAVMYCAFEAEPIRICARLAASQPAALLTQP